MTPERSEMMSGSHDEGAAGDYDAPYTFGRRPRATATFPFSMRQYARLLVLRSQVRAGLVGADDGGPVSDSSWAFTPLV